MIDGKHVWLQAEDSNEDISIAMIIREQFSTSELFEDILEAISLILLYKTTLIGPGIFPYIYDVGSNFNLHSIISNGLIFGGQKLSRRQSVFFFVVDPRKEDHKDPEFFDYFAPRHARYLQNAWKRDLDTVFWVDIDLGIRDGFVFHQTRLNAIVLQGTLPAHCIEKVERLKIW